MKQGEQTRGVPPAVGRRDVCNLAPRFGGAGAPCLPGDYRVRPLVKIRCFRDWKNTSDFKLVPLAGLEPAQCCHYLILSQARLPIPPQGQAIDI